MSTPTAYASVRVQLQQSPRTWLVTGSSLVEKLLSLDQTVVGQDKFATGRQRNFGEVQFPVSSGQWSRFCFIECDIHHVETCQQACAGVDYILHQASLGSVQRAINDAITTDSANIEGFLNILVPVHDAKVSSVTYAASRSTYGDHPGLPMVEDRIGKPLSPYAVIKYVNELYADVFAAGYGFQTIGLRHLSMFDHRQDPEGAYAAVIPKWAAALLKGEMAHINGDSETSRDFCYVANMLQTNILEATPQNPKVKNQVYNIAARDRTSLNTLFGLLRKSLQNHGFDGSVQPVYRDLRVGDVLHSQAATDKARSLLGYTHSRRLAVVIAEAMPWHIGREQPHPNALTLT